MSGRRTAASEGRRVIGLTAAGTALSWDRVPSVAQLRQAAIPTEADPPQTRRAGVGVGR